MNCTGRICVVVFTGSMLLWAGCHGVGAQEYERGREVYRKNGCAICHSIAGQGNRRNSLDGIGSRLKEDQARKWIVAPQEMRPGIRKKPYDKLSSGDLDALVAYLMSLKKPKP